MAFSWVNNTPSCGQTTLHLLIHCWKTVELLASSGYLVECCYKHGYAMLNVSDMKVLDSASRLLDIFYNYNILKITGNILKNEKPKGKMVALKTLCP